MVLWTRKKSNLFFMLAVEAAWVKWTLGLCKYQNECKIRSVSEDKQDLGEIGWLECLGMGADLEAGHGSSGATQLLLKKWWRKNSYISMKLVLTANQRYALWSCWGSMMNQCWACHESMTHRRLLLAAADSSKIVLQVLKKTSGIRAYWNSGIPGIPGIPEFTRF